jgi:U3 small nucleolar RNA-associated protein 13
MKLWTMRSQECEATFDEHNDRVWALALSPDGKEVRG